MKRQRYFLILLTIFWLCQPCFADGYLLGDMNGDGVISVADVTKMIEIVKSKSSDKIEIVDVDQDGILSLSDVNQLSNSLTFKDDTLHLYFKGTDVYYTNPYPADSVTVIVPTGTSDVFISNSSSMDMIISAQGESNDGRIHVNSNTEYKFILNGIFLTSTHAPAFNSVSSEKVKVKIADNTTNTFCDATEYSLSGKETASGCFNAMGQMTFSGDGTLNVQGKYKHAIYCKKSMTINSGTINVFEAVSDALHSGKHVNVNGGTVTLRGVDGDAIDLDDDFTMTGGTLNLDITGEAAKGVKCGGNMNISGGNISATASGALKNKDGNLVYCTILKCDSCTTISGGDFHLVSTSAGGKCISADKNLTIAGGIIYTETSGDGAEYTNAEDSVDYYTSKCIAADDSMFIQRGSIQCLSTGIGGKGLVADEYMGIGFPTDTTYTQGPIVNVETTNTSIVNDVDEDQRFGCPKAIKVNDHLDIYSGDIHCTTAGMGGEGIECNKEFDFNGGSLECNCYDDGINVGEKFVVNGGQIYCNSYDNDGIDSNGSITITGGLVTAVNQRKPNESLDTEKRQLHIQGGSIFGVGSSKVKIADCSSPFYNTLYNNNPDLPIQRGLRLTTGKYIYIVKDGVVVMAIRNDNVENQTFLTITRPDFKINDLYEIYEGEMPLDATKVCFGNKLFLNGLPNDIEKVIEFYPTTEIQ